MVIDLSALQTAVGSLERALTVKHNKAFMEKLSPAEAETINYGVILCFEFTFDLCGKFQKRWMDVHFGSASTEGILRKEFYRRCAEKGLNIDVKRWMEFYEARSATGHTFDQANAEAIANVATRFYTDARRFLISIVAANK